MSTTLDQAKVEARRIANEMRAGAEKLREGVETKISSAQGKHYNYVEVVHKLRTAHLVILAVQAVALYLEADNIGITLFFLPIILIVANGYITGKRWHHRVDGRHDLKQLTSQQKPAVKAQYALGLFGGFFFALLTHFISPILDVSLVSFLYNLSKYLSVLVGGGTAGLEVYEGIKGKNL